MLCRYVGIQQRPPGAARPVIEPGSHSSQVLAILLRCPQAAAPGENVAQIFGETLIDPKQVIFHWHLIVERGQVLGAAIFAVPGVRHLMRQQRAYGLAQIVFQQSALFHAIVA